MKKLFLLYALLIFACSGGDDGSDNNDNDHNNNDLPLPSIIKESFTDSDENNTYRINYVENTNRLSDFKDDTTDEVLVFFIYNELNQINQVNLVNSDNNSIIYYSYDSMDRLTSIRQEDNQELEAKTTIEYNNDGTANLIFNDDLSPSEIISFDSNGNIVEVYSILESRSTLYTYDNKNHPFKNIQGYNIARFGMGLPYGMMNNAVSSNDGIEETFVYNVYNDQDYPTIISQDGNWGEQFPILIEITYLD